jgi:hypothetical protein
MAGLAMACTFGKTITTGRWNKKFIKFEVTQFGMF